VESEGTVEQEIAAESSGLLQAGAYTRALSSNFRLSHKRIL
jgi:hypothetical protein